MQKPPLAVKLVGDAVCILFGYAPSWSKFKELLSQASFLKDIREFDQLSIPPRTVWKLQGEQPCSPPSRSVPDRQPGCLQMQSCSRCRISSRRRSPK